MGQVVRFPARPTWNASEPAEHWERAATMWACRDHAQRELVKLAQVALKAGDKRLGVALTVALDICNDSTVETLMEETRGRPQ